MRWGRGAGLLGALLVGTSGTAAAPAAQAPPACAAGAVPESFSLPLASAAEGVWTLPPCYVVEFTAEGVTGAPPITLTWDTDLGELFTGNPIRLDTSPYTGFHRLTVRATNPWGSASRDSFFRVEFLAVPTPVATSQNPPPGLTVSVAGDPVGATEWRWRWGDGTSSPWSSECDALCTSHTYPQPGTYAVRLEARSCNAGPLLSAPLLVTVGQADAIDILVWQVEGCVAGFCVFETGDALVFDQLFTATPDRLDYDWDGDGTTDQISVLPVTTHVYFEPGVYRPILTAHRGASHATRQHEDFILIGGSPVLVIFQDEFESGDVGAWSRVVRAASSRVKAPRRRKGEGELGVGR